MAIDARFLLYYSRADRQKKNRQIQWMLICKDERCWTKETDHMSQNFLMLMNDDGIYLNDLTMITLRYSRYNTEPFA